MDKNFTKHSDIRDINIYSFSKIFKIKSGNDFIYLFQNNL